MLLDKIYDISNIGYSPLSAVVAVIAVLFTVLYYTVKNWNLPPGPWGLPYIGFWPFLKKDATHLQLHEFVKKYGDVSSFTITGNLFINLASHKVIREAHITKSDCFAGRFTDYGIFTSILGDGLGFVNGEPWKILRKLFIQLFKEYGISSVKDNNASPIYDCINEAVEDLRTKNGEPIDIADLLTVRSGKTLRRIMFDDYGITDQEIKELNEAYSVVIGTMTVTNVLVLGEFARRFILPFIPGYSQALKSHKRMVDLLQQIVNRQKKNFEENNIRNIIDSYFKEKNERERKGDPTAEYFTDKVLVSTLVQFVGDGVLAVAFFISMFIQSLAHHPEEQDKMYEELAEVVGLDRQTTVDDRNKLPYVNAFIWETLRISTFFTSAPSLECTKETTLRGYRIPKGAITLVNIWSAQNDPNVYQNPEKFDPSRFIATPGKQREELPFGFGIGKRACIGESYVMMQLFLYLTAIIKNFKIVLPEKPTSEASLAIFGNAYICAIPRVSN